MHTTEKATSSTSWVLLSMFWVFGFFLNNQAITTCLETAFHPPHLKA